MKSNNAIQIRKELIKLYEQCETARPFSVIYYDPGDILKFNLEGILTKNKCSAEFIIEKFVGGGFAGQVYKAKLSKIDNQNNNIKGLVTGSVYAIKIIKPPSTFSLKFRNFLYLLGFQGTFSPQVNHSAIRANVLWQKLIRRGAKIYFGSENVIVDTYAIFYDTKLSSFGTINEWVEGRIWRLELDDNIFNRWKIDENGNLLSNNNSPEYVTKRFFMKNLVKLFHDMGASELARQYEWWTTKSQPNVLKRIDETSNPGDGLIAIDFFAGLALLPFLPMSPVDFKLIFKGILRGRLVQFDKGNTKTLENFCKEHDSEFKDYECIIDELKGEDKKYRESLFDITYHQFKLITNSKLRKSIKQGTLTAWKNLDYIDGNHQEYLKKSSFAYLFFLIISIIPFAGKLILKIYGNEIYRKRVTRNFKSWRYFCRTLRAKRIERIIHWHQKDRLSDERAFLLSKKPFRFIYEMILYSWLPSKWHRFIAEPYYAFNSIKEAITFSYKLLTKPDFREQWLIEQIKTGQKEGILSAAEEVLITNQVKDPFIQKYLKCLAVHICTLPITQVVSIVIAVYAFFKFGTSFHESLVYAAGILAVFQVLPVSPGSIVRGLYVFYLIIRERNIKNYWVAAIISFWHYIGYLGFPIQMVAKYPALARFMAGNWARNMVGKIPIFGEKGGLMEHIVFDFFFNLPLTIRRKIKK